MFDFRRSRLRYWSISIVLVLFSIFQINDGQDCEWSSKTAKKYRAQWKLSPDERNITFFIESEWQNDPPGVSYWSAIGFKAGPITDPKTAMVDVDMVLAYPTGAQSAAGTQTGQISDMWSKEFDIPNIDNQAGPDGSQSIYETLTRFVDTTASFSFTRAINTQDPFDVILASNPPDRATCPTFQFPVGGGIVMDFNDGNFYQYQHIVNPSYQQFCVHGCVEIPGYTRRPGPCIPSPSLLNSFSSLSPMECSVRCDSNSQCKGIQFDFSSRRCTLQSSTCVSATTNDFIKHFSKGAWPAIQGYERFNGDCPGNDMETCNDCMSVQQCADRCTSGADNGCVGFSFVRSDNGCYLKTRWCTLPVSFAQEDVRFYKRLGAVNPPCVHPDVLGYTRQAGDCAVGRNLDSCNDDTCDTVDLCSGLCSAKSNCRGFSFDDDQKSCFLKNTTCGANVPTPSVCTKYYLKDTGAPGPWMALSGYTIYDGSCPNQPSTNGLGCSGIECQTASQCAGICSQTPQCKGFTFRREPSPLCRLHETECLNPSRVIGDGERYYRKYGLCTFEGLYGYKAEWSYNPSSGNVTFTVTGEGIGVASGSVNQQVYQQWIGIGFSDSKGTSPVDAIYGYIDELGNAVVEDRYRPRSNDMPIQDASRDISGASGSATGGFITVTFTRPLRAFDNQDISLALSPSRDPGTYFVFPEKGGQWRRPSQGSPVQIGAPQEPFRYEGPYWMDSCRSSCDFRDVPRFTRFDGVCTGGSNVPCLRCGTLADCASSCQANSLCSGFEFDCSTNTCMLKNTPKCLGPDSQEKNSRYYRKNGECVWTGRNGYQASWVYDPATTEATFKVTVESPNNQWVSIGFSRDKEMENSDIILGYLSGGNGIVQDMWASSMSTPIADISSNIVKTSITRSNRQITMEFSRNSGSSDKTQDIDLGVSSNCVYFLFPEYPGLMAGGSTPMMHDGSPGRLPVAAGPFCLDTCLGTQTSSTCQWPAVNGYTRLDGVCEGNANDLVLRPGCPTCTSASDCREACNQKPECTGFDWNCQQNTCDLKHSPFCLSALANSDKNYYRKQGACEYMGENGYWAMWAYDPITQRANFRIIGRSGPLNAWTGIGFSRDRQMANSDVIVGFSNSAGSQLIDGWALGRTPPQRDSVVNLQQQSVRKEGNEIIIQFSRSIDSPDNSQDIDMKLSGADCPNFIFPEYGGQTNGINYFKHAVTPKVVGPICMEQCTGKLCSWEGVTGYSPLSGICLGVFAGTVLRECNLCSTKQQCAAACSQNSQCSGFDWDCPSNRCFLKRSPGCLTTLPLTTRKYYRKHASCVYNGRNSYRAEWSWDGKSTVNFKVTANTPNNFPEWVGIGFSNDMNMPQSDVVLGWVDQSGTQRIIDGWASSRSAPSADVTNNIQMMSVKKESGLTTIEFTRSLDSPDTNQDIDLKVSRNCPYFLLPEWGGRVLPGGSFTSHPTGSQKPRALGPFCFSSCIAETCSWPEVDEFGSFGGYCDSFDTRGVTISPCTGCDSVEVCASRCKATPSCTGFEWDCQSKICSLKNSPKCLTENIASATRRYYRRLAPCVWSGENNFRATWVLDSTETEVIFTLQGISSKGGSPTWNSIGISNDRFMPETDILVGWFDRTSGTPIIQDRWAKTGTRATPVEDSQNNVKLINGTQISNIMTFSFSRPLISSDKNQDIDLGMTTNCKYFLFPYYPGNVFGGTILNHPIDSRQMPIAAGPFCMSTCKNPQAVTAFVCVPTSNYTCMDTCTTGRSITGGCFQCNTFIRCRQACDGITRCSGFNWNRQTNTCDLRDSPLCLGQETSRRRQGSPSRYYRKDAPCTYTIGSEYSATWAYDETAARVRFKITTTTVGNQWTGIGFSNDLKMTNSDVIVGWANTVGQPGTIEDRYAGANYGIPVRDTNQNIRSISVARINNQLTMEFERSVTSTDARQDINLGVTSDCPYFLFPFKGGQVINNQIQVHPTDAANEPKAEGRFCLKTCAAPIVDGNPANYDCIPGECYTQLLRVCSDCTTPMLCGAACDADPSCTGFSFNSLNFAGSQTCNLRTGLCRNAQPVAGSWTSCKKRCVTTKMVIADQVDNDCDGKVDEESCNRLDDDGDGLTDEDCSRAERELPEELCANAQEEGTEFVVMFLPNFAASQNKIILSTDNPSEFEVTYSSASTGMSKIMISANKAVSVDLDDLAPVGTVKGRFAYRFKADQPFRVSGLSTSDNSDGAFLVFPVATLGKEYFIATADSLAGQGQIGIAATESTARTKVEIKLASDRAISINFEGRRYSAGDTISVDLQSRETLQIQSAGDLTGTQIKSDYPVAVFSSNIGGITSDYTAVMIPPVRTWGKEFVVVPYVLRGDDIVRIVASKPKTRVEVSGFQPEVITEVGGKLDKKMTSDACVYIFADNPVLVIYISSRPSTQPAQISIALIPPIEQWKLRYNIFSPAAFAKPAAGQYSKFLLLVANSTDSKYNDIYWDNGLKVETTPSGWTTVGRQNFRCARVPLKSDAAVSLQHKARNEPFGATLYGYTDSASYAMPVGMAMTDLASSCTICPQKSPCDNVDNDCDGRKEEEICDGIDNDKDGLIDEDCCSPVSIIKRETITKTTCFGQPMMLACSSGEEIMIIQAHFGRMGYVGDMNCGGNPMDCQNSELDCGFDDVYETFASTCNGQQSCAIPLNGQTMGDMAGKKPCKSCNKYAEVSYACLVQNNEEDKCSVMPASQTKLSSGGYSSFSEVDTSLGISGCNKYLSGSSTATCGARCGMKSKPNSNICLPQFAALSSTSSQAWCEAQCDIGSSFLQFDMGGIYKVSGFIVQGRRMYDHYATGIGLAHSFDGTTWTEIREGGNKLKKFPANVDSRSIIWYRLGAQRFSAKFVRVFIIDFFGYPALHFEVIRCPEVLGCKALTIRNSNVKEISAQLGQSVEVRCNPSRMTASGRSFFTTTCQTNGLWSTTDHCSKPKECADFPVVNNALHNGRNTAINSTVRYKCNPGYTLQGSADVTCRLDGTWSSIPQCFR